MLRKTTLSSVRYERSSDSIEAPGEMATKSCDSETHETSTAGFSSVLSPFLEEVGMMRTSLVVAGCVIVVLVAGIAVAPAQTLLPEAQLAQITGSQCDAKNCDKNVTCEEGCEAGISYSWMICYGDRKNCSWTPRWWLTCDNDNLWQCDCDAYYHKTMAGQCYDRVGHWDATSKWGCRLTANGGDDD